MDVVGDFVVCELQGLLYKYEGCVLLIVSGSCVVNCCYCFCWYFLYGEEMVVVGQWWQVLVYLCVDFSIIELIFFGGDLLVLIISKLEEFICGLVEFFYVIWLCIYMWLLVVLFDCIDEVFFGWLFVLFL